LSFITGNLGQFAYFDAELGRPDWQEKTVLDFGGNTGNLLKDPNCTVEPRLYTCIDVSRDAIDEGRGAHPEARFVFYDRYSFEFNPTGVPELELPNVGGGFDYILALSVFTHMSEQEMLWFVPRLRALLNGGGTLAFTILDPHYAPDGASATNLRHYGLRQHDGSASGRAPRETDSRLDSYEVRRGRWFTFVNDELFIEVDPPRLPASRAAHDRYITFYTPEAIRALFPDVRVMPPATGFPRQHCCLLGKRPEGQSP
jgi:SAM-dependent methyltransferase